MTVTPIDIARPFYDLRFISGERSVEIQSKAIVLNLAETPIRIEEQKLGSLQSVIVADTTLLGVERAVIVDGVVDHDDQAHLFQTVRDTWPTAFDVRGEERLRGVEHYMSPKTWVENIGLSLYHSASVPLNVGLHREHPFCPVPGFREVHTQIAGFGKMQQCREQDIQTLYLEEPMAPGTTHKPMFDDQGNYPWHQYETITPSIFMAVELLPDGVTT